MADQIENFYRSGYVDFIRLKAMQLVSCLRPTVDFEVAAGETMNFDRYDAPSLYTIASRNQQTGAISPGGNDVIRQRRSVTLSSYEHSELFDPRDGYKIMRDIRPDSQFSRAVMSAMGVQIDQTIETAMDANVNIYNATTGLYVSTDYATDNGATIAENLGGQSTGALSVGKIILGVEALRKNKVMLSEGLFGAVHPDVSGALFAGQDYSPLDDRFTSSDFNTQRPLESAQLGYFHGTNWVDCHELAVETFATVTGHYTWIYSRDAMILIMDGEIDVHFDILPEHRHALQVAHYITLGAIRMQGEKMCRLECMDSDVAA